MKINLTRLFVTLGVLVWNALTIVSIIFFTAMVAVGLNQKGYSPGFWGWLFMINEAIYFILIAKMVPEYVVDLAMKMQAEEDIEEDEDEHF